ncbi:MAG: SDR family NAD(P)-dependent oxidoreductase, partial [Sphaerochaetaceae bacterium]
MPKTVIITGGCRGIGLAISMRFAKEGCQVIAIGRKSEAECASVLSQIRDLGLDPFYIQAD